MAMTDNRTAIIIAAIPVGGAIVVGLMANWDKLFPRPATMAISAPAKIDNPVAMPRIRPMDAGPAADAAVQAPEAGTSRAPHASTPPEVAAAIAGTWHDEDGFTYRFAVDGDRVSYVQVLGAEPVGSGDGTLSGRTLRYRYVDARTNDRGTCEGRLSTRGDAIDGRCASGDKSWGFRITRT